MRTHNCGHLLWYFKSGIPCSKCLPVAQKTKGADRIGLTACLMDLTHAVVRQSVQFLLFLMPELTTQLQKNLQWSRHNSPACTSLNRHSIVHFYHSKIMRLHFFHPTILTALAHSLHRYQDNHADTSATEPE